MPIIDTIQTGNNIAAFMKKKGISVKEVQKVFGFNTPSCIYRWLNGTAMPTLDNLVILVAILDTDINDILSVKKSGDTIF